MTDDEIRDYWGADRLARWDPAVLADIPISDRSKAYLAEVGLPVAEWIGQFRLKWHPGLPRSSRRASRYVLGFFVTSPIFIDIAKSGAVVLGAMKGEPWRGLGSVPEEYWNASVDQFGACLTIYDRLCALRLKYEDPNLPDAIEAAEQAFTRVDPDAMSKWDTKWPRLIEDLKNDW